MIRLSKRELEKRTLNKLVKHPHFRLLQGTTEANINAIVRMVNSCRMEAIKELQAEHGEEPKQL